VDPTAVFCDNPDCPARGHLGQGNIKVHSHKEQRYVCRCCGKTFAATKGTPFYRLRKDRSLFTIVTTLLCKGCPPQAVVAAYGLDERTVADWHTLGHGLDRAAAFEPIFRLDSFDWVDKPPDPAGQSSLLRSARPAEEWQPPMRNGFVFVVGTRSVVHPVNAVQPPTWPDLPQRRPRVATFSPGAAPTALCARWQPCCGFRRAQAPSGSLALRKRHRTQPSARKGPVLAAVSSLFWSSCGARCAAHHDQRRARAGRVALSCQSATAGATARGKGIGQLAAA
jgi:transposase-like protein